MKKTLLLAGLLTFAGSLASVHAQTPAGGAGSGMAPATQSSTLVRQDYQGVPYVTGGIGEGERNALKSAMPDHNLRLTFAEKSGHYLAGVGVTVTDAKGGKVLELTSDGPIVLAKLPPGSYRISATADGREQQRRATVGARGAQALTFLW